MTDEPRLSIRGLKGPLAGPFALEVEAGCCAVITGPSGAGKSVFLRMVADLDPNQGEVRLDGEPREAFAPSAWRRSIPYVPAEAGWWDERVSDHVAPDRRAGALALAGCMGLAADLFDAPVTRLSTGEKQRFALARALVLEPRALLLDEPTGALDQASVERVEQVLRDMLAGGCAAIVVTHDEALGRRLGDRRYHMIDRALSAA